MQAQIAILNGAASQKSKQSPPLPQTQYTHASVDFEVSVATAAKAVGLGVADVNLQEVGWLCVRLVQGLLLRGHTQSLLPCST